LNIASGVRASREANGSRRLRRELQRTAKSEVQRRPQLELHGGVRQARAPVTSTARARATPNAAAAAARNVRRARLAPRARRAATRAAARIANATPSSIDCQASRDSSCKVDANLDCQPTCQAAAHEPCETKGQGGCEDACTSYDGALFCDGEYVDYGDNLQACIDALETEISAHVMGKARDAVVVHRQRVQRLGQSPGHVEVLGVKPGAPGPG
jgi:hypothetical protein